MKQYNIIFFDFDGTIVNTINGTRESALYALKYFGIDESKNNNLGKIFCGPPLRETFSKYNLNDEQIEKAIQLYRKYQSENTIECNEIYDGITEMLSTLKANGKKMYIVTAKLEDTAKKILKYFKLDTYFDEIIGATSNGSRVTKKEIMKYAMDSIENFNVYNAIMIGDRVSDIKAGISNNMDTIGVLYGIDNKQKLEEAQATFLVNTPYEILDVIGNCNT